MFEIEGRIEGRESARSAAIRHVRHWIDLHPYHQRFNPPPRAISQFRLGEVLLVISTDRDRFGAIYNQCWRYEHRDWRVEVTVEWCWGEDEEWWLDECAAVCTGSGDSNAASTWFNNQ